MNQLHFQPIDVLPQEGAASRIGPRAPGVSAGETHVYFDACESRKEARVVQPLSWDEGRALDVSLSIPDVRPGRRVAVSVGVYEAREGGGEEPRGFRAFLLPAREGDGPGAADAPALRFILPEENSLSEAGRPRHFVLRVYAHYADGPEPEKTPSV